MSDITFLSLGPTNDGRGTMRLWLKKEDKDRFNISLEERDMYVDSPSNNVFAGTISRATIQKLLDVLAEYLKSHPEVCPTCNQTIKR